MEKSFRRDIAALADVFDLIDDFAARENVGERAVAATKLTVEELFMNFIRHGKGGGDNIVMCLEVEGDRLIIRLKDFDVEPFDAADIEPVDVGVPLAQRKVGGLGIHIVRNLVDELSYDYANRTLCVTAVKRLGS